MNGIVCVGLIFENLWQIVKILVFSFGLVILIEIKSELYVVFIVWSKKVNSAVTLNSNTEVSFPIRNENLENTPINN